jgi:hypothetical protein
VSEAYIFQETFNPKMYNSGLEQNGHNSVHNNEY